MKLSFDVEEALSQCATLEDSGGYSLPAEDKNFLSTF